MSGSGMIAAKTMRAAMLQEPGRLELLDVPVPAPPPGGMVVRVRAALTDGTDLKTFRRGHPRMPTPTRFGHEFSGDVAAVDTAIADRWQPGDLVMSVHTAPCLECFWCRNGQEELCERLMPRMVLGAYAEFLALPAHVVAENCYPKPAELPYEIAAFLEPLACVVHSLRFLNAPSGSTVVIVGDGGFGLLHALTARHMLLRPVLVGRRAERMGVAVAAGVADVIDARAESVRERVLALTDGRGADAAIECTGRADVWESVPGLVRRGGIASFFGGLPGGTSVAVDSERMHYDEVRLISPFHFTRAAVRVARELLCSGAIDPRPLITESVALEKVVDVFARLDRGEGLKFAILP